MRKSCWMILVALLTITAPTAFADSFSIVFTGGSTTTPVGTIIAFTPIPAAGIGTLVPGPVTDMGAMFTFTSPLTTTSAPQMDQYHWDENPGSFLLTDLATRSTAQALFSGGTALDTIDSGSATVTLNSVAMPEPSPVVLTLIGMGLLVVMRKRKALGLAPQAT